LSISAAKKDLRPSRRRFGSAAEHAEEALAVDDFESEKVLLVRRWETDNEVACLFHFRDALDKIMVPLPPGRWRKILDSCEKRWNGNGMALPENLEATGSPGLEVPPFAAAVYVRQAEA